jgi:hypothetical protein
MSGHPTVKAGGDIACVLRGCLVLCLAPWAGGWVARRVLLQSVGGGWLGGDGRHFFSPVAFVFDNLHPFEMPRIDATRPYHGILASKCVVCVVCDARFPGQRVTQSKVVEARKGICGIFDSNTSF